MENDLCIPIELDVSEFYKLTQLRDNKDIFQTYKKGLLDKIRIHLINHFTPVLFTSREELLLENNNSQFILYNSIATFIAELISELSNEIGYLISKGGITTNTILSHGLGADSVYLEGQILKGISLVSVKLKNIKDQIPVVTFPGNIGNSDDLVRIWKILEGEDNNIS